MKKRIVRQGDVMLVQTDDKPISLRVVARDRCVLALGEATGHHHSVICDGAVIEEDVKTLERWLTIPSPSELVHQEHSPIEIPAGTYRVVRQREYSPEALRNVQD